jgi:ribonucleoside-diphosphate reductase alpha chain
MYVFREKYAAPGEQTHLDVQRRVAKALGRDSAQERRFLSTLVSGFIPGGRINASAGLERKTTLVNCFVQPLADCMTGELRGVPGIMDAIGEAAETMRQGGGVGYDFSPLRPARARVKGTDSEASGPVSYMRVFDRMCDTVESAGARRGAQMGILRIDHPDVESFVDAKKGPDFTAMGLPQAMADQVMRMIRTSDTFGAAVRKAFATLSNFNISVGVTDKFMQAVVDDAEFDLVHVAEPSFPALGQAAGDDGVVRFVYRTVRARDLWTKILRNAYETGDPGIVFLDTINRRNNLRYCETIAATIAPLWLLRRGPRQPGALCARPVHARCAIRLERVQAGGSWRSRAAGPRTGRDQVAPASTAGRGRIQAPHRRRLHGSGQRNGDAGLAIRIAGVRGVRQ